MSKQERTLDEFTKIEYSEEKEETPVGKLPRDWDVEWLNDVVSINSDGFSKDDWPSETFEYISLSDVSNGEIEVSRTTRINEAPSRAQRTIQQGDVLVGTVRPKQKSHGFVSAEHAGKICSSGFGVLRTGPDLNSRYLIQEILSNRFFSQMEAYVAGSGYPAVKISDLKKHRVSVPPLSEQRKIATVLYTVDQIIEKNKQICEKARNIEDSSKTDLFTHGYSEWKIDESVGWRCRANQFPKDWKVKPAEKLMDITRGASPRPRSDDSLFGGDVPWIKIGDAERGVSKRIEQVDSYVTEKGKEKSKFVEENTLLVANSGATCGFSVFAGVDGCVHDGWLILREYDDLIPDFLYHYINWNYNYLQSLSLGSAQTNLSTGLFGRLDIPLPPVQEQRQIVEALDSINQVATHASKEVDQLKCLKRGLMQDLLSGTVRTTDTNIQVPDEVAQHG